MVKGIHIKWTPWRSRTELLRVRGCLYPSLHYRGGSAGGDGGGEGYDMRWEVGDGEGMDGGEQDQVQDRDRDRRRWACDLVSSLLLPSFAFAWFFLEVLMIFCVVFGRRI